MKRIFHPAHRWEDFTANFYGGVRQDFPKDDTLQLYASLLKDLPKFESALQTITGTWHFACEHNLSNKAMNRVAYLGQAACAVVYGVPHQMSMGGYNLLSESERADADAMAQKYVDLSTTLMEIREAHDVGAQDIF